MSRKAFQASLAGGVHVRLARMAGWWEGRFRLWFEPGPPAEDSVQRGSIRVLLGGRVLLHEYTGHCSGEPMEGVARKRWRQPWEPPLKPWHCALWIAFGILIPLALYFTGHAMAAGAILLLTFVAEVLISAIAGKQGNDTER